MDKPFEEYIKEKRDELNKKHISTITDSLKGSFISKDNIVITFESNREFNVLSNSITENGTYKITNEKQGLIISFMFDNQGTILKNSNYLFKMTPGKSGFSLVPIKFDYNGLIIDDLNPIIFNQAKL